jgi:integrase
VKKALASKPTWTGKTRNNKVSVLRQALQLALDDGALTKDPLIALKASRHQSPDPDPLTMDETELILADMREHYHPRIANCFEAKFFTDLCTSESLGLRWQSIDFRRRDMSIHEVIVEGVHIDHAKTKRVRTVQISSRAMAAIKAQKEYTFLADKGGWVFLDPNSGERWVDDSSPRRVPGARR